MKKPIVLCLLAFAVITFSSAALADNAGGNDAQTGSILDYLGIGAGCSAGAANTPCSDDPNNGMFSSIACKVMKAFNAGVIPLYCNIVSNSDYLAAVDAAMMLYVILMGFSFLFGLVPMKAGTLVAKLLRATIIYAIVINADLYFGLIYNTVLQTTQDAVRILLSADTGAGSGTGAQNFFEYVDKGMHEVFSSAFQSQGYTGSGQTYNKTNLKIFLMGLAIWQLGGDLIGGIFFAVVIGWIINYFSIMIRYLLAMLSLMFLLMLGPIFIPTMLFDQTKYIAEEWIFMIICFMMQIVLVIAFVLMVQGFYIQFYDMIKNGLEGSATMTGSPDKTLITYNTDPTVNNGAHKLTDRANSMGYTPQDAEQYFSQAFGGNYRQKLPQMVFQLIELLVILMASTAFLALVPGLAALLVNRARFILIFRGAGTSFGGKQVSHADLFGQNISRIDQRSNDVRSTSEIKAATPQPAGPSAGGTGKRG